MHVCMCSVCCVLVCVFLFRYQGALGATLELCANATAFEPSLGAGVGVITNVFYVLLLELMTYRDHDTDTNPVCHFQTLLPASLPG